jgi:hypothetical protein
MIVQLEPRYEYSMTLSMHKYKYDALQTVCLNKLFKIFNIFYIKTTHNFERINIIAPSYVYYKIIKLTL